MLLLKLATLGFAYLFFNINFVPARAGCPVIDNPSQMFQCLTINPQAFVDLISKNDYKSFCHMANGYMTCMTTYLRDCLGGKALTGILEELQDLNLKCCISGRTHECIFKNPNLLSRCFAMDNQVTMSDGTSKSMDQIKPGDLVKAVDSNGLYIDTEIVDILHKDTESTTMFQNFYNERNESLISLTPSHLIYVQDKGYIKSSRVEIGDKIRVYSFNLQQVSFQQVATIRFSVKQGYIAPLTRQGSLLVNRVDASCYAEVNSHYWADWAMLPLKSLYSIRKLFNLDQTQHARVEVSLYLSSLHSLVQALVPSALV